MFIILLLTILIIIYKFIIKTKQYNTDSNIINLNEINHIEDNKLLFDAISLILFITHPFLNLDFNN